MPQPDHVSALPIADAARLDDDLKAAYAKCIEKLGFVPNVLQAYSLRPQKLRNFMAMYNELMLAPSGVSKLEREMVAVAVSSANRCYYCLVAHRLAVRHEAEIAAVGGGHGHRHHLALELADARGREHQLIVHGHEIAQLLRPQAVSLQHVRHESQLLDAFGVGGLEIVVEPGGVGDGERGDVVGLRHGLAPAGMAARHQPHCAR